MSSNTCPNGHPIAMGDLHCGQCGVSIPARPTMYCANGHPMSTDERFCATCGAQVVTAPTTSRKSARKLALVAVAVALALIAGGGALIATRGSSASPPPAPDPTTSSSVSSPSSSTTTATDAVRAQVIAIDGIITSSAVGRANLTAILADVQSTNCTNSPSVAQRQILSVADNRQAAIKSLQRIDSSASPAVAEMKASLLRGLEASYASDMSYARAVGMLVRCGRLSPTQPDMAAAAITDTEATSGKQAFVEAYNPLAARYGLRSDWVPRDL